IDAAFEKPGRLDGRLPGQEMGDVGGEAGVTLAQGGDGCLARIRRQIQQPVDLGAYRAPVRRVPVRHGLPPGHRGTSQVPASRSWMPRTGRATANAAPARKTKRLTEPSA